MILLIAGLLGVRIHSPLNIVLVYVTLFLFGVLFSAIATTLALFISDHDGYAAVNSMISMPLFFASNALMPYDKMPEWLRLLAMVNPLSYAIDSVRELFMGGMPVVGMVGLAVAAGVMVCVGVVQFRRTGV